MNMLAEFEQLFWCRPWESKVHVFFYLIQHCKAARKWINLVDRWRNARENDAIRRGHFIGPFASFAVGRNGPNFTTTNEDCLIQGKRTVSAAANINLKLRSWCRWLTLTRKWSQSLKYNTSRGQQSSSSVRGRSEKDWDWLITWRFQHGCSLPMNE